MVSKILTLALSGQNLRLDVLSFDIPRQNWRLARGGLSSNCVGRRNY